MEKMANRDSAVLAEAVERSCINKALVCLLYLVCCMCNRFSPLVYGIMTQIKLYSGSFSNGGGGRG